MLESHFTSISLEITQTLCQALATELRAALGGVPPNPEWFARHKASATIAVKRTVSLVGRRLGMATQFDKRGQFSKVPGAVTFYDFMWTLGGKPVLVGESEWRHHVPGIMKDFDPKLLRATATHKVLIHRRVRKQDVLDAAIIAMASYRDHRVGESYTIVQATDYVRDLNADMFEVPRSGMLAREEIVFRPVCGSPFRW